MNLIDTIKDEHVRLSSRLALLKREIDIWTRNGEPDYDLLYLLAQYFMKFPDEIHHKKEDCIYDALIEDGVLETEYLSRLKSEHEQMGELSAQFSEHFDDLLAHHASPKWAMIDKVKRFIALQELHMADEESQFLPLAQKELSQKRLKEINETIQNKLISDEARDAFRELAGIDAEIDSHVAMKGQA